MNVLIIGLRKEHILRIRNAFKGKFNLQALTDQDRHAVKQNGIYDYIISVPKFTNHSTQRLYSSHEGYILMGKSEGYSAVFKQLSELFA